MTNQTTTTKSSPRKGFRFLHRRVLSTLEFDGKTPQLYMVTKVASGWVFYKAVYDYITREEFGKSEKCQLEHFGKVAISA